MATAEGAQGWRAAAQHTRHTPVVAPSLSLPFLPPLAPPTQQQASLRKQEAACSAATPQASQVSVLFRHSHHNRLLAASFIIHYCPQVPRPIPPPGEEHVPQLLQNSSIEAVKMAVNGEYHSFAYPPLHGTGKRIFAALENHGERF